MINNLMFVIKRNGSLEEMSFDKILNRIKIIGKKNNISINFQAIAMKVIDQLYDNISTTKIDELIAEQCASLMTTHYNYGILASQIIISNHHKNTLDSFTDYVQSLYNYEKSSKKCIIHKQYYDFIMTFGDYLNSIIHMERDFLFDYFGFKTLEKSYLMKLDKKVVERPQFMLMRVAVFIHFENINTILYNVDNDNDKYKERLDKILKDIKETYDLMSLRYFIHATPTLFNCGTQYPQLSSCFLIAMQEDSLEGIYDTLKDCALISKHAGGIGMHIHNIRCKGSTILGTQGQSNGIVPMLRVFNNTARYVDQGGGKRNGSFAIYLEPWHPDIVSFLEMKKNHGDEELKGRDLFYGLWIPDLFMKRLKSKEYNEWSLFCPNECKGLSDVYGEEFERLYIQYEKEGKAKSTIDAKQLWFLILDSQMETGNPYLLYKDSANKKSNQKNIGTIKSSNLCTEIIQYSDKNETSVCNLASIGLPSFIDVENKTFDYEKLHSVVKVITRNLNKIIDKNYYPTYKTKLSNLSHRPVGIGVQGLADTFILMEVPFYSAQALIINELIFETIYHASLEESNNLARQRYEYFLNSSITDYDSLRKKSNNINLCDVLYENENMQLLNIEFIKLFLNKNHNEKLDVNNTNVIDNIPTYMGAYSSFIGSPTSEGILQFDLWNVVPKYNRYNWNLLKQNIIKYGIRNSLLVAPMPTASTSQILGFNECFEPFTSNIYSRSTMAGEFVVVNKYLMKELIDLNLWNDELKNSIISNKGSIQHLTNISQKIKDKYKIVWEIPMKHLIDMSAQRGAFICQSQSLNLWMEEPLYNKLTSMHFYSWQKGLKTGLYYLRRKGKHHAQQFTIEPTIHAQNNENTICDSCSA